MIDFSGTRLGLDPIRTTTTFMTRACVWVHGWCMGTLRPASGCMGTLYTFSNHPPQIQRDSATNMLSQPRVPGVVEHLVIQV